jgi:hypothetical protein
MMNGDWAAASAEWKRIGCPFERALAPADGDRDAQFAALAAFDELGARIVPAARVVDSTISFSALPTTGPATGIGSGSGVYALIRTRHRMPRSRK